MKRCALLCTAHTFSLSGVREDEAVREGEPLDGQVPALAVARQLVLDLLCLQVIIRSLVFHFADHLFLLVVEF